VTFEAIEAQGVEAFLEQIADELVGRSYAPLPARRQEIPKDAARSASFRFLRPRPGGAGCAQAHIGTDLRGGLPIGSFRIPTQRTDHEAVDRVARAIVQHKRASSTLAAQLFRQCPAYDRLLRK